MKVVFPKRSRGISLIEMVVATAIVSLISLAAFKILAEGLRYVRTNQLAIDAQRAGLSILSGIGGGLQGSRSDLIDSAPEGLVYASPVKDDGTIEFELSEHKLLWQKWVCYYYDGREVTLRERTIAPPSMEPGAPPSPASFSTEPVRKLLSNEIDSFQVTQASVVPPLWSIDLTIGSMDNRRLYGMELHSEVGPRN